MFLDPSIYLFVNQAFILEVLFILPSAEGERRNLRTDFFCYPDAACVCFILSIAIDLSSFILPLSLCIYLFLLSYSSLYLWLGMLCLITRFFFANT